MTRVEREVGGQTSYVTCMKLISISGKPNAQSSAVAVISYVICEGAVCSLVTENASMDLPELSNGGGLLLRGTAEKPENKRSWFATQHSVSHRVHQWKPDLTDDRLTDKEPRIMSKQHRLHPWWLESSRCEPHPRSNQHQVGRRRDKAPAG